MATAVLTDRARLIEEIEELKKQRKRIDKELKQAERRLIDVAAREAEERGSDVGMFS